MDILVILTGSPAVGLGISAHCCAVDQYSRMSACSQGSCRDGTNQDQGTDKSQELFHGTSLLVNDVLIRFSMHAGTGLSYIL